MIEFRGWSERAHVAKGVDATGRALDLLHDEMMRRYQQMPDDDVEWDDSMGRWIVLVIDEIAELKKASKPTTTSKEIAQVGTISANSDSDVGEIIANAMDKVGKEGVITVEESNTFGLELELTEGMRFDKGYISPYMVTDQDRMEATLEDPYILIANQKIGSVRDVLPVLEQVIQSGRPILIIAEDVEGEAALAWVRERNARSQRELEAEPGFAADLDLALQGDGFFEVQRPDGTVAYTRAVEDAYRTMWQRWCATPADAKAVLPGTR